jgi:hypothetical protein
VWLKALYGIEIVDVQIASEPRGKRSDRLAEMRVRAAEFRRARNADPPMQGV